MSQETNPYDPPHEEPADFPARGASSLRSVALILSGIFIGLGVVTCLMGQTMAGATLAGSGLIALTILATNR